MRSPSWPNVILAVAGVILGELERLDDPQPHAAVVWLAQRSRQAAAASRALDLRVLCLRYRYRRLAVDV